MHFRCCCCHCSDLKIHISRSISSRTSVSSAGSIATKIAACLVDGLKNFKFKSPNAAPASSRFASARLGSGARHRARFGCRRAAERSVAAATQRRTMEETFPVYGIAGRYKRCLSSCRTAVRINLLYEQFSRCFRSSLSGFGSWNTLRPPGRVARQVIGH